MSMLHNLKTTSISYNYLNNLFDLFKIDKEAEIFKEQLIPLVNQVTESFIRKYPNKTCDRDTLFSECFYRALYTTGRKDPSNFENAKAFFTYMKNTLEMSLFSMFKIQDTVVDSSTYDEADVELDDQDIRDTLALSIKNQQLINTYKELTSIYGDKISELLFYLLNKYLDKRESDEDNLLYIEERYGVKGTKINDYKKLSHVIFKISAMYCLNEDFELKALLKNKINKKLVYDKFFFTLVALEKYPFLIEIYEVIGGDKFLEFLKIFGGCSVNIPTLEEVKDADKYVSLYINTLDVEDKLDKYKIIADANNVTVTALRYNNTQLDSKIRKFLKETYSK